MTAAAVSFGAGVLFTLAVGAPIALTLWRRWADEHDYRKVRLEATRVRELHAAADHEHRLRVRQDHEIARLRSVAYDLLARLTRYRRRPARRTAVPPYGQDRHLEAVQ